MPAPSTSLLLSVADLLDRPGASRPLTLELEAPEGLDVPLVERIAPLRLDGVLESLAEGILVRGTLRAHVDMACARCLTAVPVDVTAQVAELYSEPGEDVEPGYEIRNGLISLDALLRDTLLPVVPTAPHCRPDCRGLCPTCGIDRNTGECACAEQAVDSRWAALEGLHLNDQP